MFLSQIKELGAGAIKRRRGPVHLPAVVRQLHGDTEDTDHEITLLGLAEESAAGTIFLSDSHGESGLTLGRFRGGAERDGDVNAGDLAGEWRGRRRTPPTARK